MDRENSNLMGHNDKMVTGYAEFLPLRDAKMARVLLLLLGLPCSARLDFLGRPAYNGRRWVMPCIYIASFLPFSRSLPLPLRALVLFASVARLPIKQMAFDFMIFDINPKWLLRILIIATALFLLLRFYNQSTFKWGKK